MQPARPTYGGVRAGYLCLLLLSTILLIFLDLTTPPAVHHTIQHLTMAVYKRSDAAAAAKTAAKTSTLKPRALMSSEQLVQCPLRPRRSSGSPKENNTNSYITTINLNRDRFDNVLTTLGGASPSKNATPPESPMGPQDEQQDLLFQPALDFNEPANETPQERIGSTVRIDETPTSKAPALSLQAGQEATTLTPEEGMQLRLPQRLILRNSGLIRPQRQMETQPHEDTNNKDDRVMLDRANKLLRAMKSGHEVDSYHVEDFSGLFPVWPIVKPVMSPTGQTKDERTTQFVKCITSLLGEILIVDEKAAIAPIAILNVLAEDMIMDKTNIPSNYTKLSKWIMLSGGSWVFNKKERGSSNIYARFCLRPQVSVEDMMTRISFEFSRMGGSKLYKKLNQAMETETPTMLLFVSNGTNPKSTMHDITQMLDTSFDSVDQEGMMPEEFEHKEIPKFILKLNPPQLPSQTKGVHKAYDHAKEQGKKAYHCEVAKEDVSYFHFLTGHARRLKLDVKYFGKFAKFTSR
jgi:hypothetical protein